MNGGDVMSLKRILGHATLDVTQVYMHLAESHVQGQHAKFSPVEKLGLKPRKRS
jgi:integrase/recombinase XerD